MVNCAIVGCSSDSRYPEQIKVSFHKLPAIVSDKGPQMLEIATERRRAWLSAISRDDLQDLDNIRVCSKHFVSGKYCKMSELNSFLIYYGY